MDTSKVKIESNQATSRVSTNTPLPRIDKNLLIYLQETYQDIVPTLGMTDREIWIEVGRISVVRHLEGLYKFQNELE